jgi:hypothetical protein
VEGTTLTTPADLIADPHRLAVEINTAPDDEGQERAVGGEVAVAPIRSIHDPALKVLASLAPDATTAMQAAVAADARRILGRTTH